MPRSRSYKRKPVTLALSSAENRSEQISRERLVNLYPQLTGNKKSPVTIQSWPVAVDMDDYEISDTSQALDANLDVPNTMKAVSILGGSYTYNGSSEETFDQMVVISSTDKVWELRKFKSVSGYHFKSISRGGGGDIGDEIAHTIVDCFPSYLIFGGLEPFGPSGTLGTFPASKNPIAGGKLNSRLVCNSTDSTEKNKFYVSDVVSINSSPHFDFDVSNSATNEAQSDPLLAIAVKDQIVYFMCSRSIEPWQEVETGNPPAARINQAMEDQIGIAGTYCLATTDQGVYFLSDRGDVRLLRQFSAVEISSPQINDKIRPLDQPNCVCHTLSINSETFIIFRFPTDGVQLAYSEKTKAWIELLDNYDSSSKFVGYCNAFDQMFAMRSDTEKLYELSLDALTAADDVPEPYFEIILPPISGEALGMPRQRLQMRRMVFGIRVGVAENNSDEDESNPSVVVQYSKDGENWGIENWYPTGRAGEFDTEISSDYKTKFLDLHVRLRFYGIAKVAIYSAAIDVKEAGR